MIPPRVVPGVVVLPGTVAGGGLGALTNRVNGAVSPEYFRRVLGWDEVADVRAAAIGQGIGEGVLTGLALSLGLATVLAVVSRARCPLRVALWQLLRLFAGAVVSWCLGGMIGVFVASVSPEGFRMLVPVAPTERNELLPFAWVGGSINGIQWGGAAVTVLECVLFRIRWTGIARALA